MRLDYFTIQREKISAFTRSALLLEEEEYRGDR